MKVTDAIPASLQALSEPLRPAGERLLKRYAERMIADSVSYLQRQLRLHAAREFLHWRRMAGRSGMGRICGAADKRPDLESICRDVRETYLRHVCPERDLRVEARANLNFFLRFVETRKRLSHRMDEV